MSRYNSVPSAKSEKDWQAEDDLRTLIRAEEVKADKGRLRAALNCRDHQKEQLSKIGGLRGKLTRS